MVTKERKYPKLIPGKTYRLLLTPRNGRMPWTQRVTVRESGLNSPRELIMYINRQCARGKNYATIIEVET